MKKILTIIMLMFTAVLGTSAQTVVDNGTLKDNWYVGAGVGTMIWNQDASKTAKWHACNPFKNQQLNINLTVGKMFNPYIGIEANATGLFNVMDVQNTASVESNFIDGHFITLNGVANLSNILCGYKGTPRFFEVEGILGYGWYHIYQTGKDFNDGAFRAALRADLNVSKNLAIYIMPEYTSRVDLSDNVNMKPHDLNVSVGVKYRIPSKRGGFPLCKLYDQEEVDALNSQISALRADLAKKPTEVIKEVPVEVASQVANSYAVNFLKGSAQVDDITGIANELKKSNGTILIKGYTSPEGSETLNRNLSAARAEAVKKALIDAGIDASRIQTESSYEGLRTATIEVVK